MLGGQHGHLVGVIGLVLVVDDRFHWLLVVFTFVTVHVTINVDGAGALAHFAVFVYFLFVVQARRPGWLHLRDAASLSAGLGDSAVTVLVFLVSQVNLRLNFFVGVIVDFYLVYIWQQQSFVSY